MTSFGSIQTGSDWESGNQAISFVAIYLFETVSILTSQHFDEKTHSLFFIRIQL